jgi:hypothetical protein
MLMNKGLFIDGAELISASQAAKKIGYASDYIGQLCRQKKIPSKLIGRTWYVDYSALAEHKKNTGTRKKKPLDTKQNKASISFSVTPVEKKVEPTLTLVQPKPQPQKTFVSKPVAPKSRVAEVKNAEAKTPLLAFGVVLLSAALIFGVSHIFGGGENSTPAASVLSTNPTSASTSGEAVTEGMVVTPDSSDHTGLVAKIKSFFSDDVKITFDEGNDTGVITPNFRNGDDSNHYAFVMVPVNKAK